MQTLIICCLPSLEPYRASEGVVSFSLGTLQPEGGMDRIVHGRVTACLRLTQLPSATAIAVHQCKACTLN